MINTIINSNRAIRISLSLSFFAVSASFTPMPENKQVQLFVNRPQTYCLANVASLGTGLERAPVRSRTNFPLQTGKLWTGWVRASASGYYEFSLPDRGGQIFVNRQRVFSHSMMSPKSAVIQIELLNNRFYAIRVETAKSGKATLPLRWRRPDGRQEAIPTAYLYAPVATAAGSNAK